MVAASSSSSSSSSSSMMVAASSLLHRSRKERMTDIFPRGGRSWSSSSCCCSRVREGFSPSRNQRRPISWSRARAPTFARHWSIGAVACRLHSIEFGLISQIPREERVAKIVDCVGRRVDGGRSSFVGRRRRKLLTDPHHTWPSGQVRCPAGHLSSGIAAKVLTVLVRTVPTFCYRSILQ